MDHQSREAIEAPKFWRKVSLQQGEKNIQIEQFVEDFAPSRTTVKAEGQTSQIEHGLTLGCIREKHLPPGSATCTVHLKDDLDIIFPDMGAAGKLRIRDRRYQQEAEVAEHIGSLAEMQIEEAVKAAEEAYLKNNASFTDPYQREDSRVVPITFKTGSEEALCSQLTALLHSFPKIFELVPGPRVFVYTEFNEQPASFNIHLWHQGQTWKAEDFFLSMVKPIIRENTPTGHCYRNGTGELERVSEFDKDSLLLTIAPDPPTPEQVQKARQHITTKFDRYGLTLNPEIFQQNPLKPHQGKAGGNGKFTVLSVLVGFALLGGL